MGACGTLLERLSFLLTCSGRWWCCLIWLIWVVSAQYHRKRWIRSRPFRGTGYVIHSVALSRGPWNPWLNECKSIPRDPAPNWLGVRKSIRRCNGIPFYCNSDVRFPWSDPGCFGHELISGSMQGKRDVELLKMPRMGQTSGGCHRIDRGLCCKWTTHTCIKASTRFQLLAARYDADKTATPIVALSCLYEADSLAGRLGTLVHD